MDRCSWGVNKQTPLENMGIKYKNEKIDRIPLLEFVWLPEVAVLREFTLQFHGFGPIILIVTHYFQKYTVFSSSNMLCVCFRTYAVLIKIFSLFLFCAELCHLFCISPNGHNISIEMWIEDIKISAGQVEGQTSWQQKKRFWFWEQKKIILNSDTLKK